MAIRQKLAKRLILAADPYAFDEGSLLAEVVKNEQRMSDGVTKELYGHTEFVVDTRHLRTYYERHEPNSAWRDWPTFLAEIEQRVELHLSLGG